MVEINLKFRDKLAKMIGGELHNLCYQCGACVGDCPAAKYSDNFNPRIIMLQTLLGMENDLINENSIIWECTNCFTCYERCPQDVKPIEVIIALKNMVHEKNLSPNNVTSIIKSVMETGRTVVLNDTAKRRRAELGLPPLAEMPIDDIAALMTSKPERSNE